MLAFASVLIQCIVITKSNKKLEGINTNAVNIQHLKFSVNSTNKTYCLHGKPVTTTTTTATKTKTTTLNALMLKKKTKQLHTVSQEIKQERTNRIIAG